MRTPAPTPAGSHEQEPSSRAILIDCPAHAVPHRPHQLPLIDQHGCTQLRDKIEIDAQRLALGGIAQGKRASRPLTGRGGLTHGPGAVDGYCRELWQQLVKHPVDNPPRVLHRDT